MKKLFLIFFCFTTICVSAQLKKDGTPDMRYKANKETYGNTYSSPAYSPSTYTHSTYSTPKAERNYSNGGQLKIQSGYTKSNGTYVSPHVKTTPDNNTWNNKNNW